jgi:NTE family protein
MSKTFSINIRSIFTHKKKKQRVALVLSAGGARGYAHIGAIEELQRQGFEITSVAGTSMGSLVGGMFAAGKLEDVKQWMLSLNKKKIRSLVDISIGLDHVIKGEKVISALQQIVPDTPIENLPIPFSAIATDIVEGKEALFRTGSLYQAIRSSISIPSLFKPVHLGERILIDGGILNPLPLNRIQRSKGDILVAVNVSAHGSYDISLPNTATTTKKENRSGLSRWIHILPSVSLELNDNYFTLLMRSFQLMIQRNTVLSQQLTPPDITVNIPMEQFGAFDYDKAEEIIEVGSTMMREAIEAYRKRK